MALLLPVFQQYEPSFQPNAFLERLPNTLLLTAVALLGVVAWAMLRLSKTLPITQFFRYSALLIAILAVVLIGKGIGALQEAGSLSITALPGFPRITALGLFPTVESVGAQLAMIAALLIGFRSASRPRRVAPAPAE